MLEAFVELTRNDPYISYPFNESRICKVLLYYVKMTKLHCFSSWQLASFDAIKNCLILIAFNTAHTPLMVRYSRV